MDKNLFFGVAESAKNFETETGQKTDDIVWMRSWVCKPLEGHKLGYEQCTGVPLKFMVYEPGFHTSLVMLIRGVS